MTDWHDLNQTQRIKRWEGVLRVLRELTPHERRKHFDMSDWLCDTECGTVGCAAGHCALDPKFRRQGFKAIIRKVNEEWQDFPGQVVYDIPDPVEFFGEEGTERVFYKDRADYKQTVKNIKDYIRDLKDFNA